MGDAVLQLVVSEGLLARYHSESIGKLADLRSCMIDRSSCFRYAKQLGLQKFLVVGNAMDNMYSEDLPTRVFSPNIMAELFEAILGAIYVDSNLQRSSAWFTKQIGWPPSFDAAVNRFVKQSQV